ncbi:hypothetical protein WA026_015166 [Henosepilachna vigintioctopunctata]|uniref:Uncharacterized protein n=1 Tax=Henosepilachna vigintioctopunctata TaxID=420089 RepID=A0AAW1TXQ0_9CUCU
MNSILKISLGLLVLCVLVWSSPTDVVSPLPETQIHTKEQNSTNNQHNHTAVVVKTTETATRSSSKTTIAPELNREANHSSPSKISAEQSTPLPETHGSETATVTASKKPEDQPNQNDKSSASVPMQMYPFALTSLAVLLFSAM